MSTTQQQTQTQTQEQVQAAKGQYPVPPAGEEIHLPGGSALPLCVAVGVTLMVIGITIWWVWSAIGFIVVCISVRLWIRDSRREFKHLPDELGSGH